MKVIGDHNEQCRDEEPKCLCNTCIRDENGCCLRDYVCPIENCPDYEPEDEDECTDDCDRCAYCEHVAWHTWTCTRPKKEEDNA